MLKVAKRKSVVFILSDFMDEGYWSSLRVANRKHDIIGLRIHDKAESDFPNLGLMKVNDSETKESFWIDSSSDLDREAFGKMANDQSKALHKQARKIGLDLIPIQTDVDFVEPLMSFFRLREKRY